METGEPRPVFSGRRPISLTVNMDCKKHRLAMVRVIVTLFAVLSLCGCATTYTSLTAPGPSADRSYELIVSDEQTIVETASEAIQNRFPETAMSPLTGREKGYTFYTNHSSTGAHSSSLLRGRQVQVPTESTWPGTTQFKPMERNSLSSHGMSSHCEPNSIDFYGGKASPSLGYPAS
jgi:hypothetical protein